MEATEREKAVRGIGIYVSLIFALCFLSFIGLWPTAYDPTLSAGWKVFLSFVFGAFVGPWFCWLVKELYQDVMFFVRPWLEHHRFVRSGG